MWRFLLGLRRRHEHQYDADWSLQGLRNEYKYTQLDSGKWEEDFKCVILFWERRCSCGHYIVEHERSTQRLNK